MKLNLSFDWAILTSIFGFLFYWCGYCYYLGSVGFYGINIDAFDIPVISIVIQGFIHGYEAWITLAIIFFLFSYITSISRKHWLYWLVKGIALVVNLLIILYYLVVSDLLSKIKNNTAISKVTNSTKEKNPKKLRDLILSIRYIFTFCTKKISEKSSKIEFLNNKILTRLQLTAPQIKTSIYGEKSEAPSSENFAFDLSFLIHYILLLLLLVCSIHIFDIGQKIIDEGSKRSKDNFEKTVYAMKIKDFSNSPYKLATVKDQKTKQLFLTDICLKSLCLVTDERKNVQVYDIKDIKIDNHIGKRP